ncbi:Hypothetical protein, putative [Bodo saltans]|uniref:Uncharacterized protein n=1 Tax=Bodo saltans TaxID=75058 RepID=A0A0S4JRX2_BODSA|nr:Hypothetical protein, putative [Bodo saltans]|eukprot:CUG91827.1 Hypothetical protein, putative [Bodo saltans]
MKPAGKQRTRKRGSVVPQVVIPLDQGENQCRVLSPSTAQQQRLNILDNLVASGISPALSQKLQDLFGLRFEQLQTFWGLYSVLSEEVGLQVSPDEVLSALDGPIKQRLQRDNDVSVDGNTHVDTIEVFRYLVSTLRSQFHSNPHLGGGASNSGFVTRQAEQENERRTLIQLALLEKMEHRHRLSSYTGGGGQQQDDSELLPPQVSSRRGEVDDDDAMQQIVRGAVARLRSAFTSSTTPVPPPALMAKAKEQHQTTPQQNEFTASDVELVWEHLFTRRRADADLDREANAETSAVDDVYNNLPAELRALVAAGGQDADSDSAAGSHGDRRGDSMYLRGGRSITRLASKTSIRKAFMHSLDFSKTKSDDETSFGSPRGEDSFGFSATIVLDGDEAHGDASLGGGVDSPQNHKKPPPSSLDAIKQLENALEANARECQEILEGHGVITESDENAVRLAEEEMLKKQAALLARYRSSMVMFQERKRTTRLQSLLTANSTTGDGSSGAAMSRTMSAFDFGDRNSSVDNAEIRPFLPNDDAGDGTTQTGAQEILNDSFGAYVPVSNVRNEVQSVDNSHQQSMIMGDPQIPGEQRPHLNNNHNNSSTSSRPGSSGTAASALRQWSTATTDLRPNERSHKPTGHAPPSQPSSSGGEEDDRQGTLRTKLSKVPKANRRRNNDEAQRIRQHSEILTKAEKQLLHSKRLSTDALRRECVSLPVSVQQLLPSTAAKVVEKMRGTSAQLPPRAVTAVPASRRTSDVLGLPRPHSSQGHRTLAEGTPGLRANTPATRVSTPQWSRVNVAPSPLSSAIPTITCSPPQDHLTMQVSVASREECVVGAHNSTSYTIASSSVASSSFLQVPERPGTAPRKLTPFSLTAAAVAVPHDSIEFLPHTSPTLTSCVSPAARSTISSMANSLVPSRSTSPTKELQHLPWPPSPPQGQMVALLHNNGTHNTSISPPLLQLTDGRNWNRWLQGGGDVTHAKAGFVKAHRRASSAAL